MFSSLSKARAFSECHNDFLCAIRSATIRLIWIILSFIDPRTNAEPKCCDVSPDRRHPACWPIDIPSNDPFYSLFGRRCLEFVRSATGLKDKCKLGSRSTFNTVTSFLDASFVYGTNKETANKLRTFRAGWLKSNSALRNLGLKDLLPARTENPDENCKRPSQDLFCFEAGDSRVNQQVMLVTLHVIFLREHNRLAAELGKINPHWDDERIFQVWPRKYIFYTQIN